MSQIYTIKCDNDGPRRFKLVFCDFDGITEDVSYSDDLEELASIRDKRIERRKFCIDHLKICLIKKEKTDG